MSFSFFSDVSSCFARGVYIANPLGTRSFNDAKKQSRYPQDSCRNDQSRETQCGGGNHFREFCEPLTSPWYARQGARRHHGTIYMLRSAFPDIHISLDHEIAEGEYVVHHITVTGTHKGDFMGHAATDKKATWKEIHILQFEDGKAVAHWGLVDMMGLMMQLGVMPQPEMTKK